MAYSQPASDLYGTLGAANVTAVLGPTNTGKTHLAIERMLSYESGLIGLPLRLLAREVYDKIVARVGPASVALITGEEKIKPKHARYWVSTVEAMPRDIDVEFVAVDEIQLAADPDRGHVFTDRLFHARGSKETLLLGADTMRNALIQLLPGVNFISRPRLSQLTYAGPKKISRLPRRTAIVAFSVQNVYEIAEFVRRQRGGAAVVLGALSPRTRNAQVELFQSGDVDFLIATDAIGMGLNLDVHHVAFAGIHKFDGIKTRELMPAELAQIAGRAGRHLQDGTFGVTADVPALSSDLINRIEAHDFDPVGALHWRARSLDFSTAKNLLASLKQTPGKPYLMKARDATDVLALEALLGDDEIADMVKGPANVQRLWEVCQIPDYRKIGPHEHSDLVKHLFHYIIKDEARIPVDWMNEQIEQHSRVDGDIDTLATRIAHIRTWTFVANRVDWLDDPAYWQGRTREIEDKLSDALHEGLTKRFVDQRTSTLMKRLRDKDELFVEIDDQGLIHVEDHYVGKISGFLFTPDSEGTGIDSRAARSAAVKILSKELMMRSKDMIAAEMAEFSCAGDGTILWKDTIVGQLQKGDHILKPRAVLQADEQLNGQPREDCQVKLQQVVDGLIEEKLPPLVNLERASDLSGLARGVAFQLIENLGVLLREPISDDIRQLDQEARGQLRKFGVRFGAFNIYFPILLKPAPTEMARLLWKVFHEKMELVAGWELPRAGLTSAPFIQGVETDYYKVSGFHVCGRRVVRVDMLERLADLIRPLVSWRANKQKNEAKSKIKTEAKADDKSETKAETEVKTEAEASKTEVGAEAAVKTNAKVETAKSSDEQQVSLDEATASAATSVSGADVKADDKKDSEATSKQKTKDDSKAVAGADKKAQAATVAATEAPTGATGDGGFTIVPDMMSIMGCSAEELGDVLRSLGFQGNKKKAVAAQTAETETAARKSDTTESDVRGSQADNKAPSTEDAKAVDTKPEDEAKSDSNTDETSVVKANIEEEIIIWRPRRKSGLSRGGRPAQNRQGKPAFKKSGQKSSHGKGRDQNHKRGGAPKKGNVQRSKTFSSRVEPKKIDPDSPFAKLQALKDKIENKAG